MTDQKSDSNRVSPTFVAQFSDGVVTKMTCHCAQGNLDVRRGIVISRIAYESRTKGKEPPPIVEARFQTPDGKILCEYDNKAIADGKERSK
jgi:hypothetical protein